MDANYDASKVDYFNHDFIELKQKQIDLDNMKAKKEKIKRRIEELLGERATRRNIVDLLTYDQRKTFNDYIKSVGVEKIIDIEYTDELQRRLD